MADADQETTPQETRAPAAAAEPAPPALPPAPPSAEPPTNRPAQQQQQQQRPPREQQQRGPGGGGPPRGEGQRSDRGPREGGPRGENRGGGDRGPRREGERGDRRDDRGPRGDRGDRGRPEGPPEIDLDKLMGDPLYLDNQAHAVVSRMRDMDSGTRSQLRRLYNAVRRAVRAPENERQHEFVMLRARLAYTIARHGLRSLDQLERLLLQVTRKNEARGYERFRDLFEAIVAYNE